MFVNNIRMHILSVIDNIGFHGPLIMAIITISQIWKKSYYLVGYILGFFANKMLNEFLKETIKGPRPEPINLLKEQKRDIFNFLHTQHPTETYIPKAHLYGMPSGHAQTAGYSLGFLYCIDGFTSLWYGVATINGIVFFQRWYDNKHTILQLCIGGIIGSLFAFCIYTITKKIMKRKYENKIL